MRRNARFLSLLLALLMLLGLLPAAAFAADLQPVDVIDIPLKLPSYGFALAANQDNFTLTNGKQNEEARAWLQTNLHCQLGGVSWTGDTEYMLGGEKYTVGFQLFGDFENDYYVTENTVIKVNGIGEAAGDEPEPPFVTADFRSAQGQGEQYNSFWVTYTFTLPRTFLEIDLQDGDVIIDDEDEVGTIFNTLQRLRKDCDNKAIYCCYEKVGNTQSGGEIFRYQSSQTKDSSYWGYEITEEDSKVTFHQLETLSHSYSDYWTLSTDTRDAAYAGNVNFYEGIHILPHREYYDTIEFSFTAPTTETAAPGCAGIEADGDVDWFIEDGEQPWRVADGEEAAEATVFEDGKTYYYTYEIGSENLWFSEDTVVIATGDNGLRAKAYLTDIYETYAVLHLEYTITEVPRTPLESVDIPFLEAPGLNTKDDEWYLTDGDTRIEDYDGWMIEHWNCTLEPCGWTNENGGDYTLRGYSYTYNFEIFGMNGYYPTEDTVVTVNGKPVDSAELLPEDDPEWLEVYYTFELPLETKTIDLSKGDVVIKDKADAARIWSTLNMLGDDSVDAEQLSDSSYRYKHKSLPGWRYEVSYDVDKGTITFRQLSTLEGFEQDEWMLSDSMRDLAYGFGDDDFYDGLIIIPKVEYCPLAEFTFVEPLAGAENDPHVMYESVNEYNYYFEGEEQPWQYDGEEAAELELGKTYYLQFSLGSENYWFDENTVVKAHGDRGFEGTATLSDINENDALVTFEYTVTEESASTALTSVDIPFLLAPGIHTVNTLDRDEEWFLRDGENIIPGGSETDQWVFENRNCGLEFVGWENKTDFEYTLRGKSYTLCFEIFGIDGYYPTADTVVTVNGKAVDSAEFVPMDNPELDYIEVRYTFELPLETKTIDLSKGDVVITDADDAARIWNTLGMLIDDDPAIDFEQLSDPSSYKYKAKSDAGWRYEVSYDVDKGTITFHQLPTLTGFNKDEWMLSDKMRDQAYSYEDDVTHIFYDGLIIIPKAGETPTVGDIASVTVTPKAGGQITLSWTEADGATAYIVHRRERGSDDWARLEANVKGTSYTDESAELGKVYQYRIRGRNGTAVGNWKNSAEVAAMADNEPGSVGQPTAAPGAKGQITVSWDEADGSAGYIIQRNERGSATWTTLESNYKGTSYLDKNTKLGKVYRYRVRSRNVSAFGPFKVCVEVAAMQGSQPGVVGVPTVAASAGKIIVSWTGAEGAASYILQRRERGSDTWTTLNSNIKETSYVDTAGEVGAVYQYRVRSRNVRFYGPFKASVEVAFMKGSAPEDIASVTATASKGKITVSWSASSGAAGYIVQRKEKGGSWENLDTYVTETKYVDKTVKAGKVYQYRIRPRNGNIYGSFKAGAEVTAQ